MLSDLERRVMRDAEAMTKEVHVDGKLVDELKRGLSPETLMQLTLTIASANFTNRVNEAMGTELEH